jgi:hypothetical protein
MSHGIHVEQALVEPSASESLSILRYIDAICVHPRVIEPYQLSPQHDERALPRWNIYIPTEPPTFGHFNTLSKTVLSAYQERVVELCR